MILTYLWRLVSGALIVGGMAGVIILMGLLFTVHPYIMVCVVVTGATYMIGYAFSS